MTLPLCSDGVEWMSIYKLCISFSKIENFLVSVKLLLLEVLTSL